MAKVNPKGQGAINDVDPSDVVSWATTTIRILKDLFKKSGDNKK